MSPREATAGKYNTAIDGTPPTPPRSVNTGQRKRIMRADDMPWPLPHRSIVRGAGRRRRHAGGGATPPATNAPATDAADERMPRPPRAHDTTRRVTTRPPNSGPVELARGSPCQRPTHATRRCCATQQGRGRVDRVVGARRPEPRRVRPRGRYVHFSLEAKSPASGRKESTRTGKQAPNKGTCPPRWSSSPSQRQPEGLTGDDLAKDGASRHAEPGRRVGTWNILAAYGHVLAIGGTSRPRPI